MRILYFAVNQKHSTFFEKVRALGCQGEVVISKRLWLPSLKALFTFPAYLHTAATLRQKDFQAKYHCPLCRRLLKPYSLLLAYWNYVRYSQIRYPEYTHIMVWNSSLFRQSIAVEIAKSHGLKPIVTEMGLLPGRIVIDLQGANYLNSVPRDTAFYQRYPGGKVLPDTLIPRMPKSAKKFSQTVKNPLPEAYLFVPFQVDYDTQILLFSPWIKNMEMLFSLLASCAERLQMHVVFKEHPSSKKKYPKLHAQSEQSPYLHFANGYPTQTLIEGAEAVLTINSTVGIESLLFHKRVIVLGQAFYAIEGITKQALDREALMEILSTLQSWQPDQVMIDRFLSYLYEVYLIEGDFDQFNETQLRHRIGCMEEGEPHS